MNTRLKITSQSTIATVVRKWWDPFLILHSYPSTLIPAGSPLRGGVMASFALHLAKAHLKYGTIQGYVWAISEHHIQQGGVQADPLDNVQDWSRFMKALEVQTFCDSTVEPHEMVPFLLLVRTLRHLDPHSHEDVLLGIILVFLFHTMSRSETPVPKTRDGAHNFDAAQHIRCRDVRVVTLGDLQFIEWGFGNIKQDSRSKRARRDPDNREWKLVGEAQGILSMILWYNLYLTFVGQNRNPNSPFFGKAYFEKERTT